MDKKSTDSADTRAHEAVIELVQSLLGQNVPVAQISFALAFVATDLGLQMAPSAEHAFAVVADAIRQTATNHAFAHSQPESGVADETRTDEAIDMNPKAVGRTVH